MTAPDQSRKRQIPLASRAPSIHGTQEPCLSRSPAWPELRDLRTPIKGLRNPDARLPLTRRRLRPPARVAMQQRPASKTDIVCALTQLRWGRCMKRRKFIALVGSASACPLAARSQQAARHARIGFLSPSGNPTMFQCFEKGLEKYGWIAGRNLTFEYRQAEGRTERIPALVADLVRLKLDLIAVAGTQGSQELQRTTREIPVVFMGVTDPVASGIVASLAHPGGNVTGLTNFNQALVGKLLELLRSAKSNASPIYVLHDSTNTAKALELRELQSIETPAIAVKGLGVRSAQEIERAFGELTEPSSAGLIVLVDGVTATNRDLILQQVAKHRLPGMYQAREFVDAGGLMSYGMNFCDQAQRAAMYADKILKGSKPSDLPVELPTTYELIINAKSAKALGIVLSPELLARADEVIE